VAKFETGHDVMNRTGPPILPLVVSLLLVGCGRPPLMPTPMIFAGSGIDAVAETPAGERATTARVFYATDRTPREYPKTPFKTYTNERDYGLRLGVASVDLAPGRTWEELHALSLEEKRRGNPTPHLTKVEEFGSLWREVPPLQAASVEDAAVADRFASEVQAALDETALGEIFIFVHGFNTRFDDNCLVAAELQHFIGSQGVFMSYAWPSRGSLFAYGEDKASAQYSIRYFRLFLAYLAERTDARRINVIGHSAGAPVAVGAIRELCLMHFDEGAEAIQSRYRIGQLVLAAPDMDLGVFVNAVHDEVVGVPEQMAIYFSTRDKALDFSAWIFGFARLGEPLTELTATGLAFLHEHSDVALIDVVAAEKNHGSWLGHSYFHEDPWVSSDLVLMLRHHLDPAARGLVTDGDSPIWGFPKDYPERSRSVARGLYDGADGADGAGTVRP
jgi:esterase/lipase superfamily enzyme